MTLKLLDTFAGIGGFSYAAEKLVGGFKTTQFVEINPFCQKILKIHWPYFSMNLCESSAWFDQNTSSWRTWQLSLTGEWTLFSENFPKQGMMQNMQLFPVKIWEAVTSDKDGGVSQSLPTPTARDYKDGCYNSTKNCKKQDTLGRKIHLVLPTPTASEHKARMKDSHQSGKMLSSIARRGELSPQTGQDMFLNPAFVEEMMGYEVGWTELDR
jgi:hypothetical protein